MVENTVDSSTELAEVRTALAESEDDIQSLRALGLYGRRLPLPLIQQQLGVKRTKAYELIRRGKALVGLMRDDELPKVFLLSDDLIRECLIQYQQIEGNQELTFQEKTSLKNAVLTQINQFLVTQIKAKQAGQQKSETTTVTSVPTEEGSAVRVEVRRETKTVDELLQQLQKEGKIGKTA